jgi:glucose/mannose transport system permease protein
MPTVRTFSKRLSDTLRRTMPLIVISPSLAMIAICVYGFIAFTAVISLTSSKMLPSFHFVGLVQYAKLLDNDQFLLAIKNMAIFGGLYIVIGSLLGLFMAVLLDQRIRAEGFLRTAFLYPMALSFVVTGVIWQWILNPGLGIEKLMHTLGWASFQFTWLIDPNMAIYTIVIAGLWQVSGFVMALFLAGLRGIDGEILKAAKIDGASQWKTYTRIIIPALRPVFLTALVIQANMAVKSFDLVVALTNGGPGTATELPSTFMYSMTFTRDQMGLGAASAVVMLMTIAAIVVPYLYSELREDDE